jgi:hypothetical protein
MTRQQKRYQERQEVKEQRKISSGHNENLNRISKRRTGLAVKMKDEILVLSKKAAIVNLIAERDYYMSNKGAKTKSVGNRITRIESVIVAREKILSEMLKKKEKEPIAKQAEGIDMAAIPPTIVT